jgi:hypothetical protein
MLGPVAGVTAALGAVVALVGPAAPVAGTAGPFGGAAKVQVAHIGKIEVDLEATSTEGLRRVPCGRAASASAACFVARPRSAHGMPQTGQFTP